MAQPTRNDPRTIFCFKLIINIEGHKTGEAYFKSVSGLKYESEVVDYKEGGVNISTHRLVGSTKWPNLVLKKGFTGPPLMHLLDWRRAWLDDAKSAKLKRADGKLVQLAPDKSEICAWEFFGGWPCKWEGPEYDASKSELAIETLEIAHEGLKYSA